MAKSCNCISIMDFSNLRLEKSTTNVADISGTDELCHFDARRMPRRIARSGQGFLGFACDVCVVAHHPAPIIITQFNEN